MMQLPTSFLFYSNNLAPSTLPFLNLCYRLFSLLVCLVLSFIPISLNGQLIVQLCLKFCLVQPTLSDAMIPPIGQDLAATSQKSNFLNLLLWLAMNVPSEQYLEIARTDDQLLQEFLTFTLHSKKIFLLSHSCSTLPC